MAARVVQVPHEVVWAKGRCGKNGRVTFFFAWRRGGVEAREREREQNARVLD